MAPRQPQHKGEEGILRDGTNTPSVGHSRPRSTPLDAAPHSTHLPMDDSHERRLGLLSLLGLAAWCGLAAGLSECGALLLRKRLFDADQILKLSRYFVLLIPVTTLCLSIALGIVGCALVWLWPRRGRWLFARLLAAFTLLPALMVAFPRIYAAALIMIALGAAVRLVPIIELHRSRFLPFIVPGFVLTVGMVAILGFSVWLPDRSRQKLENARPLPPPGSPNVLLIVLDTVAAKHLSLNGYNRPTTTTLDELAARGIRFDWARSTSSWTLPSHASMFTGRWLHELSLGWLTPLNGVHPTVAEVLSDHGYATAGFVANTWYCGTTSGLSRGFTHYQDEIFPELTFLKTSDLVARALDGFRIGVYFVEDWLRAAGWFPTVERLWQTVDKNRKDAAEISRELLDWLSSRDQPQRPFFAFLNYYDAHYPYQLQPGRLHRFGVEPSNEYQRTLIQHWWELDKTTVSLEGITFASNSYDDCVADLDEQIGKLIDQLDRRGVLEQTWVIIVSDHGESFGEHPNVFCHGSSVYDTEVHVPLLIIPPPREGLSQMTVKEAVSLRDIAATIATITGGQKNPPFPGASLSRFWGPKSNTATPTINTSAPVLSELVPNNPKNKDYWGLPEPLSPRASIKTSEWSYIHREAQGREELYELNQDPNEQRNLAGGQDARETVARMRTTLDKLTEGPLVPSRFPP